MDLDQEKTNMLLIYKTIDQTLIIFICISRIPMNPSINFISTSVSILVKNTIILSCTKNVRLNTTNFFIMKIPIKKEPQQITISHSSDIVLKDFRELLTGRQQKYPNCHQVSHVNMSILHGRNIAPTIA